jgi:hypothetical protein
VGEHLYLGTQAAVKVLDGKLTVQHVQAFTHEAQTIAKLRYPHILLMLDFSFDATTLYRVMEYSWTHEGRGGRLLFLRSNALQSRKWR